METRRIWRLLGCAAIALLLAGCFKVNMDLEVSADDMVSGTAVIAVDESLLELSGQSVDDLFAEMDLSDLPEGSTAEPYEEDGFVGQQITIEAVPLSEFAGNETLSGGATGEDLSIVREGDEFHVTGGFDMSGEEFTGTEVPQEFMDNFEFQISITFPGEVISSTGTVDGNTVTWEPKIGQNTRIEAVASAIPSSSSPVLLIVLIAVGALALGAIVYFLTHRTPAPAAGPTTGFDTMAPPEGSAGSASDPRPAVVPRTPRPTRLAGDGAAATTTASERALSRCRRTSTDADRAARSSNRVARSRTRTPPSHARTDTRTPCDNSQCSRSHRHLPSTHAHDLQERVADPAAPVSGTRAKVRWISAESVREDVVNAVVDPPTASIPSKASDDLSETPSPRVGRRRARCGDVFPGRRQHPLPPRQDAPALEPDAAQPRPPGLPLERHALEHRVAPFGTDGGTEPVLPHGGSLRRGARVRPGDLGRERRRSRHPSSCSARSGWGAEAIAPTSSTPRSGGSGSAS